MSKQINKCYDQVINNSGVVDYLVQVFYKSDCPVIDKQCSEVHRNGFKKLVDPLVVVASCKTWKSFPICH